MSAAGYSILLSTSHSETTWTGETSEPEQSHLPYQPQPISPTRGLLAREWCRSGGGRQGRRRRP